MVFNVHVTPINENPTLSELSSLSHTQKNGRRAASKQMIAVPSLITVPADNRISNYPVRIFNVQPQE